MAPATTGGPPGNEHLAALTQHVDEVELTVRVLVLRGVVGEVIEHGER